MSFLTKMCFENSLGVLSVKVKDSLSLLGVLGIPLAYWVFCEFPYRVHSVWKVRENNIPGKAGLESQGKSGIVREKSFFVVSSQGKSGKFFYYSLD